MSDSLSRLLRMVLRPGQRFGCAAVAPMSCLRAAGVAGVFGGRPSISSKVIRFRLERGTLCFRKRFVKSLTLTEKLNLTELRMTATESVLDFYDRCNNNINLFYEEEWETLVVGQTNPGIPWGTPGVAVTEDLKKVSKNYHMQCVNIHLKLAFAAGLKDSIKRQTLIQPTESLESILEVAQRVEASQKEIKKEVALVEVGDSEDEADVEVGAVNYQRKAPRPQGTGNRGGAGGPNRRPGGPQTECYYCFKPQHFKRDCITSK